MLIAKLKNRKFRQIIVYVLLVALVCPMMIAHPSGVVKAEGEDRFDQIRERYKFLMTGGTDFNPEDPQLAYRIDLIESAGQARWDSMTDMPDPESGAEVPYLWEDEANHDSGGDVYNSFIHLKNMALAYATKGSGLEGNIDLRDDILAGLDWMVANSYSTNRPTLPGNWWEWEIGAPQQFLDAIVIMYDELGQEQLQSYMEAISHYSPNVDYFIPNWGKTTGANRIWKASIVALQGVLMKSEARIQEGRTGMDPVLEYVTKGDGFYEDGSFVQHAAIPSNGSYGAELYTLLPNMMYTFEGSDWEFSQEHKDRMFRWTFDSYIPLVYNGALMDMVRGRSITRPNEFDFRKGHEFTRNLVLVAEFAPPEMAAEMKAIAKHYIEMNDQWEFFEKNPFLYNLVLGKAIMENAAIVAKEHEAYSHIFAMMDRAVHQRPDYAFGISMHSERIYRYESINNENKKGWYTGDGMTYLYNGDRAQYVGNFWPTVNPYRLPGTTVDTSLRENSSGQQQTNSVSWVGGSELSGVYSSVGMEIDNFQKTLTGKKSWFMFDEEMVALGAGITGTGNTAIETTVEQRKLNAAGDNDFTVDGEAALPGAVSGSAPALSETLTDVSWAHLEGSAANSDIGYYFPGKATINAVREARSGNWNEVGTSNQAAAASYLTMYYDHGVKPNDAAYAYAVLPNKSAAEMAAYSAAPKIEVLANADNVQAVRQTELGITGANFWTHGIAGDIKAFNPASVTMREDAAGGKLTVAVSDPTQKQDKMTIEIKKEGIAVDEAATDDRITVLRTAPTLQFEVNTADGMGRSFELALTYDPNATPDFAPPVLSVLQVTADSDVILIGDSVQVSVVGVNDDGTTADLSAADITYSSSNEAAITVDETGLATGSASGQATITATAVLGDVTVSGTVELRVPEGELATIALAPSDDTYVRGNGGGTNDFSNTNYGASTQLNVAHNTSEGWIRRAFFKFDLSAFEGTVVSAKFNVYAGPTDGAFAGTTDFKVYQVDDDDWDESTMTWNNQKPLSALITTVPVTNPNKPYEIDISDYVKSQLNADDDQISIAIIQDSTPAQLLRVYTKEESVESRRPFLSLEAFVYEYPLDTVQIAASSTVLGRGDTAQLTVTGTDTNNGEMDMENATIVYSSSDPDVVTVTDEGVVTAQSIGTASITAAVTINGVTKEASIPIEVTPSDDELVYNVNDTMFAFHGTWNTSIGAGKYNGDDHYSSEADAYYEVTFKGIQASVLTSTAGHHGIMAVSIDGGEEELVDAYSLTRYDEKKVWTSPILDYGTHTLKVRVTGDKNASSGGTVIPADQVMVLAPRDEVTESEYAATDDTFVRGGTYASAVQGTAATLNVAKNVSEEYIRRAFFQFDLADVQGDVQAVILSLFAGPTDDAFAGTTDFSVYAVDDDDWDESSLNWSNQKPLGERIGSAPKVTVPDKEVKVDITAYALEQLEAGDRIISVAVVQENSEKLLRIRSKEHADEATRPHLEVAAAAAAASPPNNGGVVIIPTPTPTVQGGDVTVPVKPDPSGKASATVPANAIQQAVGNAEEGKISVTVKLEGTANSVEVSLPSAQLKAAVEAGEVDSVTIHTGFASVTLSKEQLASLTESGAGNVKLNVSRVDTESLPSDVRERVGDYPVFDFGLTDGSGAAVSQFASDRAVTVAIDYTLKPGENPATLVVYYLDEDGQLVVQKHVRYDESAKQIVFSPKHFSKYAAANVSVTFEDIQHLSWAKSSIEALAAREIVQGVGGNRFDPSGNITRAEFVQMLIGALDVPTAAGDFSFTDVSEGAWYYDAVMTAAQLGIVKGKADGSFGVNEPITRQDIAVMTYRAALAAGALDSADSSPDFIDEASIAAYAKEAVASMNEAGLIKGYADGSFAPLDVTTRAEAAVIMDRLLQAL